MKKAAKFDGVPVKIGRDLYDRIKDYVLFHNKQQNVQTTVNEGLEFWFGICAETETEHVIGKMATKVAERTEEPCYAAAPKAYPAKYPS